MTKLSKSAALREAQLMVSKIVGRGARGYGRQWAYFHPYRIGDLRVIEVPGEIAFAYAELARGAMRTEVVVSNHEQARVQREAHVAEVALYLMGYGDEDDVALLSQISPNTPPQRGWLML